MQALGAEIVVTFEGCSEGGDQFMARQSYLPDEIHWGFTFASIISKAPGSSTRHVVDISKYDFWIYLILPELNGYLMKALTSHDIIPLYSSDSDTYYR